MSKPQERRPSHSSPDFGTAYVPNAGPSHLAPKSLDHFKRGYEERAAQREKEHYTRNYGPTGRTPRSTTGGDISRQQRPVIVKGLNINNAVDRLARFNGDQQRIFHELDIIRRDFPEAIGAGKAITVMISVAARNMELRIGNSIWEWMDARKIQKNTFHYNSMISVTEKARDYRRALAFLQEMKDKGIPKNEVSFSSAISACEKSGQWEIALELLDSMDKEKIKRSTIVYNAAISACEKGMVPKRACDVFQRMKSEGIRPTVVSYSALISAAEKGSQWRLALEILEEMKQAGFHGNVVAYSAAISALAKGQQWRKALDLFREIQAHGGTPSIVTFNATMTALEKGMQWELAMDLFEEMKMKNLPVTVVRYARFLLETARSHARKGFQYRQCLEYLDEMTDMGIPKNVIIFGAAMSCMEKCSRADIGFELLKRMRADGVSPNVHIYNSLISACSRSGLWEKGYELYEEMGRLGLKRDVVTYNAVLDATSSQMKLARRLFQEGVEKGFYAKVSRVGELWLELDVHFLSLGGGEVALSWWFEVCLIPYLSDVSKLKAVKSISIVTGYGKTRTRGRRHGDDGMRKRMKAMLKHMHIKEEWQENAGRIYVDKEQLVAEVNKNGGKIIFDLEKYNRWKELETTANVVPEAEQKIRARFKPKNPGSRGPPFIRIENDSTSDEYRLGKRRNVLDVDVSGPDYRSDIDYAVRDGIRFAIGGRRAITAATATTDGKSHIAKPTDSTQQADLRQEHCRNQSTFGQEDKLGESGQRDNGFGRNEYTFNREDGNHQLPYDVRYKENCDDLDRSSKNKHFSPPHRDHCDREPGSHRPNDGVRHERHERERVLPGPRRVGHYPDISHTPIDNVRHENYPHQRFAEPHRPGSERPSGGSRYGSHQGYAEPERPDRHSPNGYYGHGNHQHEMHSRHSHRDRYIEHSESQRRVDPHRNRESRSYDQGHPDFHNSQPYQYDDGRSRSEGQQRSHRHFEDRSVHHERGDGRPSGYGSNDERFRHEPTSKNNYYGDGNRHGEYRRSYEYEDRGPARSPNQRERSDYSDDDRRKRTHVDSYNMERRASNGSRGYAIGPETQRRRLS